MNPSTTTRVDLHCHSTASEVSKLGVQRSLGLPECATPPDEVYELAKRRGMDFVTITDHDTIDGCLEIADRPDAFISEELTAWFRNAPQAVHVLCFGITPDQHEWLQENSGDLEECAEYLHSNGIACSLAHPFYAVEAPLTPAHRRRLAQLFPVWETRNGSRARELNQPAAVYIETQGGTGTGGSDDHAGVDIGRTYTETPPASTPEEFLAHIRAGRAEPKGEQGGFAKWAHAAMALATRAHLDVLGTDGDREASPDAVLKMAARVMSEGDVRSGAVAGDLTPEDGRALLDAFTDSVGLGLSGRALIEYLQADDFDHRQLAKHARRVHESRLGAVIDDVVKAIAADPKPEELPGIALEIGRELFQAAVPAIPYAPAAAFLEREKAKLNPHDGPTRIALIADGIGSVHGVTRTIEKIRELGVPGHDVEVIGTDPGVDRRLPAVRDLEAPFYRGLELGVPSLPGLVEVLSENQYDLIHLTSPGPANVIAALLAKVMDVPVIGSYHTEFGAYAGMRQGAEQAQAVANAALSLLWAVRPRSLAQPRDGRLPGGDGNRPRPDRALGPRC
jgi:predicted metal-dependent phosphoesterase TrpH